MYKNLQVSADSNVKKINFDLRKQVSRICWRKLRAARYSADNLLTNTEVRWSLFDRFNIQLLDVETKRCQRYQNCCIR